MQITAYNPQKGRLETIDAEFTKDNTTWFSNYRNLHDVSMITDIDGNILISKFDYSYPTMIYGVSRSDIDFNQKKAKQLRHQFE
jgi:prophage tail gpP-like protein